MKRDVPPRLLVGLLVTGALATGTLSLAYIQYTRKLRALQEEAALANQNLTMFQQLAAEAAEYSKTHPAIEKVLSEIGMSKVKSPLDQGSPQPATK